MPDAPSDRPAGAFQHEIRVAWGDCDPAKIVYTPRLPWFALEAIDAWWQERLGGEGWFEMVVDRNIGTPFVHMSMDFRSPVTPRHRLICHVWPVKLGNSSITFRVDGEQNGTLSFSGTFVSVFVVADAFKTCAAPEDFRRAVEPHLAEVAQG